jgi:putative ABC transport system substrate-binding protein
MLLSRHTRRREFITLLGGGAAAWPLVARAQQARKIPTIGVLWHAGSAEEEGIYPAALRQGLKDFGYVEGQNIILHERFPAEIPERFYSLATELVALKVDVLVAINRLDALAAQRATSTIPIVFVYVSDPVGSKLVRSLAHPGGNITGLSNFAADLTAKRVEDLKMIVPGISRVALFVNPDDKESARRYVEEGQAAAKKLDLFVRPVEIRSPRELTATFLQMRSEQIDGIVVTQDGLFYSARKEIADLALANRLPTIVYSRETVLAGALASYGPNNYEIFRRAGYYINKILKDTKPADLPVEQPTKLEFIVNRKTAETLGIALPQTVLGVADDVIE